MSQILSSVSSAWSNLPLTARTSVGVGIATTLLYLGRRYFNGPFVPSRLLKESNLRGQVVLVTGTTKGGLGYYTVKSLYSLGATVVMAVRNVSKGEEERKELEEEFKSKPNTGKLVVMKLDLNDLESVREFSGEFLKSFDRLDILVNNAGLAQGPGLSKQGIEVHFAVNHLGHFLLVHFLKDLIKKTSINYSTQCKIINVSSMAQYRINDESKLLFNSREKLMHDGKGLPAIFAYGHSKLCNVLFAKSLAREFEKENLNIGCYSLHPGVVSTNVWRENPWFARVILFAIGAYLMKTPESGAQTQIYLCLEKNEKLRNGAFYKDCGVTSENSLSLKEKVQDNLWRASEELCRDFSSLKQ